MSGTLPPLVDESALAGYLQARLPGAGELVVERHRAGHSNETFFVSRGRDEWVLRRPPRGAFLPSAHDVAREHRVLVGLSKTDVRAPRPVLMCEDESVIGAPFFLMERVRGVVIRSEVPSFLDEGERGRVGAELVDALVELHRVDPGSCGLASLGKGRGYLERQLRRWSGQLELTVPYTRPLPALQRARSWLEARMPQSDDVTIVHGDYKLDNVMFRVGAPARLASIFDWEMCTLGDPLADVAWMTVCWREASDDPDDWFARISRVTEAPGFGTRAELMHRYAHATGRDLSALGWYQVLALYKLAILLEGSYARHLAGVTDDPFFVELETAVPALADRALTIAEA